MASTTQILFNSPALHSLKRDQLVKLCKIHALKANGKNVELIERLKQRALELPPPASDADDADVPMDGVQAPSDDAMEEDAPDVPHFGVSRPSEQWEIVMDDIEEEDEPMGTASSKGTMRTVGASGEFGTANSKASVGSSIKALATSFGIKRTNTTKSADAATVSSATDANSAFNFSPGKRKDSLAQHAVPYADLPPTERLPQTDGFKFSTPDASILEGVDSETDIPSHPPKHILATPGGSIFGVSAIQPTVRLITAGMPSSSSYDMSSPPRLRAIDTDFDIQMGTPSALRSLGTGVSVWPASPGPAASLNSNTERLYPALPLDDYPLPAPSSSSAAFGDDEGPMPGGMYGATATPAKTPARRSTRPTSSLATPGPAYKPVDVADMFSPAKAPASSSPSKPPPAPPSAPDVFSPAKPASGTPGATIPRSTPFLFGSPLPQHHRERTSDAAFSMAAKTVLDEMNKRLADAGVRVPERRPDGGLFGGASAARPAETQPADRFAKTHDAQFNKMPSIADHYAARRQKRKSDALGGGLGAGKKRRSSAAGVRAISNGARKKMAVPGGFGDEEDEEEEEEEDEGDRRMSKRVRVTKEDEDVHKGKRVSIMPTAAAEDQKKQEKERAVLKKKLDASKARRRSSKGRVSISGKAVAAPAKTSRFGFIASAKNIVRNVWGFGGGQKPKADAATASSSIPVPRPAVTKPGADSKSNPSVDASKKGSTSSKPSVAHTRAPSGSSSSLLKPSAPSLNGTVASTTSTSRSRSPIPSFASPPNGTRKSMGSTRQLSTGGTAHSRTSSVAGAGTAASRQTTRTSTVSSMGTRTSVASGSAAVSSLGTRRSLATTAAASSSSSNSGPTKTAAADMKEPAPLTVRKRTSSLLAPTASSLAKTTSVRGSLAGRTSGLPSVTETRAPAKPSSSITSANSPKSPYGGGGGRIFSQPLTNFGTPRSVGSSSPAQPHGSLGAAAASLLSAPSPSKIPLPVGAAIPPKPKGLVARKPRISRSQLVAKISAQRAGEGGAGGKTRSSIGAARRSFGGVKAGGRASAGAELLKKKRARQSEYARRRSRAAAGSENEASAVLGLAA